MITFSQLAELIRSRGADATSLAALIASPVSKSLMGILAARTGFRILKPSEEEFFDLYVCEDSPDQRVALRSPFATVCVDGQIANHPDAFARIYDTLRQNDLHTRPVILLHAGPIADADFGVQLRRSTIRCVKFDDCDLLDLLQAHPPRTVLTKRVVAEAPLTDLNPYIYRGPVGGGLFVGRQSQLEKLTQLKSSYALVGPRAIGKTSLVNRAFEKLRKDGNLVIRAEFSPALTEADFVEQIVTSLISEYNTPPSIQRRISVERLQRLLERLSARYPSHRAVLFIDEADTIVQRCPRLPAALRAMHNRGTLRLVLVGFKELRKAANDSRGSELMNVLQELPLSRLSLDDCKTLIFQPMNSLDIKFQGFDQVAELIYRESGGAPSRIQLYCYALVEELSRRNERQIDVDSVKRIVHDGHVQAVLGGWYRESTTQLEKQLAGFAALLLPLKEEEFIRAVEHHVPDWRAHEIKPEIDDLKIADVLQEHSVVGTLDFTFPMLRLISQPNPDQRRALDNLKNDTRLLVKSLYMGGVWKR